MFRPSFTNNQHPADTRLVRLLFLLFVISAFFILPAASYAVSATGTIITEPQLDDISSTVSASIGGMVYNRATRLYSCRLSLKNNGEDTGTLVIALKNLPVGINLEGSSGMIGGTPYLLTDKEIAAGGSLSVSLQFRNPSNSGITVQPVVYQLINGKINARAVRALSRPFTIVAVPDTQVYAEEGLPEFGKQIDWILENAGSRNIVFVSHLGDVVDNGDNNEQWQNAMAAINPLLVQNTLPFSVVRGNHDDPDFFLANIRPEEMKKKSWFIGATERGLTQAQIFRVEGACFIHIGFQMDPGPDELAWANHLLARPEFRGIPVIVSTHDYLNASGRSANGKAIWNEFIKNNPMVFMTLNGHTHTEYALVNHNTANRPVYQMLSDYQDRAYGGNGLMRLITIDPVQSLIDVKTFSPYFRTKSSLDTNYFETDADSQFQYSVNIKERLAFDTTFDFGAEPPPTNLPALNPVPASVSFTHIFQNRRNLVGTTIPYEGTVDTQINENNANLNYSGEATLSTDLDDSGSRVHAMLRFDGIIGTAPGQIPPGSRIKSAGLVFSVTSSTKGSITMHRMLKSWGEESTWMDFTPVDSSGLPSWTSYTFYDPSTKENVTLSNVMVDGGIQADNVEAMTEADAKFSCKKPVPVPFVLTDRTDDGSGVFVDITKAVQAWTDGQTNYGWFLEPDSTDGWDFETGQGRQTPALVVTVEGAPVVQ